MKDMNKDKVKGAGKQPSFILEFMEQMNEGFILNSYGIFQVKRILHHGRDGFIPLPEDLT
ncbi:MAG TPA: hypothetical protein DEF39_09125 [Hungateiclostridium thermocellum]|nr:hypothetical protein EPD62_02925 [Acetivibrio thermocellus]CDG36099.1 hypothetical protein CTHBC1_1458 [Acetivibrio thermocellus BC1]HBW27410.1 hypothetical protein [Acetivibrio thermocellus]